MVHRFTWMTQVKPTMKAVARTAKSRNKTIAYRSSPGGVAAQAVPLLDSL
ncbi:hypothetical protein GCM10017559_84760 [Streptosporangium longisporum]|uniref:Uncharacterized protein n=1 Tax=Streptosporangium longisporum TaxID=46187 RepID=A0ABP6LHV5_9ACTN